MKTLRLSALLLLLMAACGKSDPGTDPDPDPGPGDQTVRVTGVSFDRENCTLTAGLLGFALPCTVKPANATDPSVTWSSSVPGVATVDPSGHITPLSKGKTIVTAKTTDGGFTASCEVTVDANAYVWDGESYTQPKVMNATAKTLSIEYASDLAWLAAAVNGTHGVAQNDFAGWTLNILTAIDLNNKPWEPIGSAKTSNNVFRGTITSGGSISNLNVPVGYYSAGLFGKVENATLRNIWIISGSVSSDANLAAGICADAVNSTFEKCVNRASVTHTKLGTQHAAGICGRLLGGLILQCCNTGTISGQNYAAGICGGMVGVTKACLNTGSVSAVQFAGGIACYVETGCELVACVNQGTVSSQGRAGGLCCDLGGGTITASCNIGEITGGTGQPCGGICALNDAGHIEASYYIEKKPSDTHVGQTKNKGTTNIVWYFSEDHWPSVSQHSQWGTGYGEGDNKYWSWLGGWNGGGEGIVYPRLYGIYP